MNFQLTKEQEFVRKMVREFATNEVEPLAADIDKEHRFPVETVEKMAKYGMLGVPFPTEYGRRRPHLIRYHSRRIIKSLRFNRRNLFSTYFPLLLAYLQLGKRRAEEKISA